MSMYQQQHGKNNHVQVPLQNHTDRWMHMSALAGDHRQDDQELRYNRPISPQAFKAGLPPQVAARVERLHILMDTADPALPEWLDVLGSCCFALQHLYLNTANDTMDEAAQRMRRLYILYRLPDLLSIDGELVTDQERALARPNTPNGHRVNRDEWVAADGGGAAADDEGGTNMEEVLKNGEIVEVTVDGIIVKPVPADPPQESFDEPELVMYKQQQHRVMEPELLRTKEQPSPAQSPALQMSEVSEDDTSPSPTNINNNTYLTRFHAMQTLCSRSEKYLPMEESEPLMLKAESRTSLSFNSSGSGVLALNQNSKPVECKASPSTRNSAVISTPERRALPVNKTISKTPPRLLLTPTHSPGASPNVRYFSTQSPKGAASPVSPRSLQSPRAHLISSPGAYSPNGLNFSHYGNVTMSPSKGASLTSPFPMQFRARTKKTKGSKGSSDVATSVPKFSMQDQVDETIKSKGTIDDVVMTTTVPSSPTTAAKKKLTVATTSNNRPPPCPGRTAVIPSPHEERRKRLVGRWRNRTQLRSNSMMDKDDDDDDDDLSGDENNQEQEENILGELEAGMQRPPSFLEDN
jgi:hypothetical protein